MSDLTRWARQAREAQKTLRTAQQYDMTETVRRYTENAIRQLEQLEREVASGFYCWGCHTRHTD